MSSPSTLLTNLTSTLASQWRKARDFEAGQERVKMLTKTYLPHIGEPDSDVLYTPYLERALLLEVVSKTISSMKGLVYRKDPVVQLTPRIESMKDRASNTGDSLYTFGKEVLHQVINPSRVGILVDLPKSGAPVPYLSKYMAEDIVDVDVRYDGGIENIVGIKLREVVKKSKVLFDTSTLIQYRVLYIEDGVYKQKIQDEAGTVSEVITPIVRGSALNFIPFVFINGNGSLSYKPDRPVLMPIVNVNESHFRTSADNEHSLHYTALPQLVLSGFAAPAEGTRQLGPAIVLESSEPNAKAEYITLPDLGPLERALANKEKQMSVLGANLFLDGLTSPQTATESAMRNTATNSTLTNLVVGTSDGLTKALKYADIMAGGDGKDVRYELNTQFFVSALNPSEVSSLVQLYQQNLISENSFFNRLVYNEMLPSGKTAEQEIADIKKEREAKKLALAAAQVVQQPPAPVV